MSHNIQNVSIVAKENDIDIQESQLDCNCENPNIQHYFNGFIFCEQCESFIFKKNGGDPHYVIMRELYKDAVKKNARIEELEQRLMLLEGLNITI